ncbi:MAG: sulfatase-like hydrolase/transferase [Acidobacteriaceae bacterium]
MSSNDVTNGAGGQPSGTRRNFLKQAAAAALVSMSAGSRAAAEPLPQKKPNIVIFISDEFRADFVRANEDNPTTVTPNLDSIARHGTNFDHCVTNQPLCTPSRGCLFTGRYATEVGTWKLGLGFKPGVQTIADAVRQHGYTANYIGKWHLAPFDAKTGQGQKGFVTPEHRGGFNGLWEASNVLELTSEPYHGMIWNGDGTPMPFENIYRADFITDLAVRFLKQDHEEPFLLVISQIEPHQQNNMGSFVPPKRYEDKFKNPFVPHDLRPFPGNWYSELPGYYGSVQSIDDSVGKVLQTLKEKNLQDDTIFVFLSDHGNHFKTRNAEYKRSAHDASIRIPLLMQGPNLNDGGTVSEIVSMVDVAPTILDAAGLSVPTEMEGRSMMPLVRKEPAREQWSNEAYVQISSSMTARAIRTPEWTYCAVDPDSTKNDEDPYGKSYRDYQLYNNAADPAQIINLAGRWDHKKVLDNFRDQLGEWLKKTGEPDVPLSRANFYP